MEWTAFWEPVGSFGMIICWTIATGGWFWMARPPLRCTDGRPGVVASIDGRSEELVVDSGSPTVVLYEKPSGAGATVLIDTNEGSTPAQRFRAPFALPGGGEHLMGAVRVDVRGPGARTASGQRIPVGICVQSRGIRAIHALVGLGGRNG